KFVSHVAVQNVLYLSGTVPLKDGKPFRQGFLGKDLTVADGQEAARYAALVSLGAMKYALGDLDRVERIIQVLGFVNSYPGFAERDRLRQDGVHMIGPALLGRQLHAEARDEDHGQTGRRRLDRLGHLPARHVGHGEIAEHDVESFTNDVAQRVRALRDDDDLV